MTGNQGGPMTLAKSALKWSLLAGRRHPSQEAGLGDSSGTPLLMVMG